MYICVYIYIIYSVVDAGIHVCKYIYIHIYIYTYIYIYTHIYVCIYILYVYTYICVSVYFSRRDSLAPSLFCFSGEVSWGFCGIHVYIYIYTYV